VASAHARCAWADPAPDSIVAGEPARHQTPDATEERRKDGQMNAHHTGTTEEAKIAPNSSQSMTLLIDTLASDGTYSPARRRHAPAIGRTVGAVAVVAAGLLLGALAG